jgi:hypothetical protein
MTGPFRGSVILSHISSLLIQKKGDPTHIAPLGRLDSLDSSPEDTPEPPPGLCMS